MAITVSGVRMTVEGGAKFSADLQSAQSAVNRNRQEMRKLTETYGSGSKDAEFLRQKQQLLGEQLESQRTKTQAVRAAQEAYRESGKATAAGLEKLDMAVLKSETEEAKLTRELGETTTALAQQAEEAKAAEEAMQKQAEEAKAAEEAAQKQAEAAKAAEEAMEDAGDAAKNAGADVKSAAQQWQDAGEQMVKAGDKIAKAGTKLTRSVTTPLVAAGAAVTKLGLDFEDAMYTVATLPSVDAGKLDVYSKQILEASNDTGVAATELAKAQYQAISAGQEAETSAAFVAKAAKAAKAGLTDTSTVVDGATSILNSWGKAAGGVDHVLDVLATAQNEGKTTIGDIASQIGQITGIAPQLNMSLEDTVASVAALTKNGVTTSAAINGLKAVLSNILKPTTEASKAAKKMGLDFSAAALESKGFGGFLADVLDKTQGDSDKLAQLFGSVEGLSKIMALGGSAANDYADILSKMGDAAGTVDAAFTTRTGSKLEQFNASLNRLKNSGIDVAEGLTPAVDMVTSLMSSTATMLDSMDDGTKQAGITGLAIAAGAGPAITAVGKLTSGLGKVIGLMSGPYGLAVAGGAALVAVGVAIATAESESERLDKALNNVNLHASDESVSNITSAINDGIDAAETEHDVHISVQASMSSISEELNKALEDGKLTRKEGYAVTKALKAEVDKDLTQAKEYIKGKKQDIVTALTGLTDVDGNQIYTEEDAEVIADAATQSIQDAADQLDQAKTDYIALVNAIVGRGGSALEEEVAHMGELMNQITQYREQLKLLQDESYQEMHNAYTRQTTGNGDEQTLGESYGYVGQKYALDKSDTEEVRDKSRRAFETAYDAAAAAGADQSQLDKMTANWESQDAAYVEQLKQIEQQRIDMLQAIWDGLGGQDGNEGATEELKDLGALAQTLSELRGKNDSGEWDTSSLEKLFTSDNLSKWAPDLDVAKLIASGWTVDGLSAEFGDDYMSERAGEIYSKMQQALIDGMEDSDDSLNPFMAALQTMADAGIDPDSVDWTQVDGTLADAMRLHLLDTEGVSALGSDAMDAIGSGITQSEQDAVDPAVTAAQNIAAALKQANVKMDAWERATGSIGTAIEGASPDVLKSAWQLRNAVEAILSGTDITVPGVGIVAGNGGGISAGNGPVNPSLDASVQVYIGNANMQSRSSITGLANELAALNRSNLAGVGIIR